MKNNHTTALNNIHQKRIAAINDLAGHGRCALSVALPLISSLGIECCPLPTALLSTNGAFPGYVMHDQTDFLEQTVNHYISLDLKFDGIISGFLTSEKQVDIIENFVKHFKKDDTLYVLDPIMGDNGHIYSVTSDEVCKNIGRLLPACDICTPNLTELMCLAGMPYSDITPKPDEIFDICKEICTKYNIDNGKFFNIVITGIVHEHEPEYITNFVFQNHPMHFNAFADSVNEAFTGGASSEFACITNSLKQKLFTVKTPKNSISRFGTGDIFTSMLAGYMVNGYDLLNAVKSAAAFVAAALDKTDKYNIPPRNGVCFEEMIYR